MIIMCKVIVDVFINYSIEIKDGFVRLVVWFLFS